MIYRKYVRGTSGSETKGDKETLKNNSRSYIFQRYYFVLIPAGNNKYRPTKHQRAHRFEWKLKSRRYVR